MQSVEDPCICLWTCEETELRWLASFLAIVAGLTGEYCLGAAERIGSVGCPWCQTLVRKLTAIVGYS